MISFSLMETKHNSNVLCHFLLLFRDNSKNRTNFSCKNDSNDKTTVYQLVLNKLKFVVECESLCSRSLLKVDKLGPTCPKSNMQE